MIKRYQVGLIPLHYLILLKLKQTPISGMNLYRAIDEMTGSLFPDRASSVYNALKSMMKSGLVEKLDDGTYRITSAGERVAQDQTTVLLTINQSVRALT